MMTLKDGKFFNDGHPYPLEFGNKDQLKLIEKVKVMRSDGIMPIMILNDSDEFCGLALKCVCGSVVHTDYEEDFEETIGVKTKCPGCNFKYVICADEYDFLFYKLVN